MYQKETQYQLSQTVDELPEDMTVERTQKTELRLKKENLEEFLQME